ncbi:MAG TPA: hypothetical protein VG370_25820 [Chloroflexota bacterium]|nr:hypothetical protein [Chloroflexota bacterium]
MARRRSSTRQDEQEEGRAIALQLALVRLIRVWIDIVADQPPAARALLLVLFLATLAMYALGLASVVVAARLAAIPTEEPTARVVRQTVYEMATAIADQTPELTPTPALPAAGPAGAALASPPPESTEPTRTPTPGDTPTPTATLEPTPTQYRAPAWISPVEPTLAPRPVRPTAPGQTDPPAVTANPATQTAIARTPTRPGGASPTPTVRLGGPSPRPEGTRTPLLPTTPSPVGTPGTPVGRQTPPPSGGLPTLTPTPDQDDETPSATATPRQTPTVTPARPTRTRPPPTPTPPLPRPPPTPRL